MTICKNGHLIPEGVNGVCPRCGDDARKEKRFGKPKKVKPEQYFSTSGSFASASEVVGPLSSKPSVDPTSITPQPYTYSKKTPKLIPKLTRANQFGPARVRPKTRVKPPGNQYVRLPDPDTRHPGMILLGIKQILQAIGGDSVRIESILSDNGIASSKVNKVVQAHHPFVKDVRDRWFTIFADILTREQARVIARSYGLDAFPRPKDRYELARRVGFAVTFMERLRSSGLAILRQVKNRNRLIQAIVSAAQQHD